MLQYSDQEYKPSEAEQLLSNFFTSQKISILSLAVLKYKHFLHMIQTLKLNIKNRKKDSLVGLTPTAG